MRIPGKKRLLLAAGSAATVGAVATLVSGVTFGLFSSSAGPQANAFTAGTVTVGEAADSACTVTTLMPGDGSSCTFATTYSGATAYEALDVTIATKAGSGGTALYDGTNSSGLNVGIADNQGPAVTYSIPTTTSKTGTTCPSTGTYTTANGYTCYNMANEILATGGASVASDTFTVTYSLPSGTGNGYQGGGAAVLLAAHAVQQANNAITCSTTAPSAAFTAGSSCTPTVGSWS